MWTDFLTKKRIDNLDILNETLCILLKAYIGFNDLNYFYM